MTSEQKLKNQRFILIFIACAALFVYLLSPILMPFFIGILLAYLAEPLVKKLMRLKLSRTLSVSIVFLGLFTLIFLLVLLLIPLIENQITTFTDIIPKVIDWFQNTTLPWVKEYFGLSETLIDVASVKALLADNIAKAGGAADWVVKTVLHSSATLLEWAITLILIPVVTFYLLCDWNKFVRGIQNLLPRNLEPKIMKIVSECDEVLSAFFRGQLMVMFILSILYSAALTLIGLPVGLVIGIIAGIVSIVPYLGFIVGVTIATLVGFVQFQELFPVILIWIAFISIHLIENMFLTPYFVGNRIGLHPVAVIFAVLAGGCLFGFLGVLLALPVAAVIMVCLRHVHREYRKSDLYKSS